MISTERKKRIRVVDRVIHIPFEEIVALVNPAKFVGDETVPCNDGSDCDEPAATFVSDTPGGC